MVKVTAPALSMDARGSLGGTLTFSNWKGRPYVRQLVKPSNPKSPGQVATRAMMKFLGSVWANIAALSQATWDTLAAADSISAFNAYIRDNMKRWTQNDAPAQETPAAESDLAGTATNDTATAGVGQIQYDVDITTLNQNWGIIIFRKTGSAPTGIHTEAVAVIEALSTTTFTYVDTGLEPGTYYYKSVPFSLEGVKGALSGGANATVT
jgi:hypothetical protein